MPLTIERLRLGIVGLAALLLLTIVGSFFYGRWRLRHMAHDLPARLGIQIQQSTQGFVLSQSNAEGRNVFTLHAARAVEFKSGGRVSLHDVQIELYNQQTGQPDTIAGDDFEYDPRGQIVQSHGEAHIVLHARQPSGNSSAAKNNGGQPIRLTTHGLIFNRKTGVATCSGEVDFATSDASGQAVGAEFDSKQGHLLLESQVVLMSTVHDQPATLHASRAMYDRGNGQIDLVQPRYVSATPQGKNSGAAAAAAIFLRADNSAQRLDAQGEVQLVSADGMSIRAPSMQVLLNENNQPRQANFSGGVAFSGNPPGAQTRGNAQQTQVNFDARGHANRVVLNGDVHFQQQVDAGKSGVQRMLAANHLVLNLSQGEGGRARLQSANAAGNAVFTSSSTAAAQAPQKMAVAAQVLNTTFDAQNQPEQMDGTGQTRLQMIAANGDTDTSSGDTLHMEFGPRGPGTPARHSPASGKQADSLTARSIRTAVQTGHIVVRQTQKSHSGSAPGQRVATATAARASYVAADGTLTLTGDPVVREGQLEMIARQVDFERAANRVLFRGGVQATMQSEVLSGSDSETMRGGLLGGTQPVHIIAEQAVLLQEPQQAVFSGRARLWQGGDMVEAPVIELSQKMQILMAYGNHPCKQCVASNFLGEPAISGKPRSAASNQVAPPTFRVLTQRLLYSEAERKASFLHHVRVISSAGVLTADQAEVYLTSPPPHAAMGPSRTQGKHGPGNGEPSSVEKIVATGNVRLLQPGRSATGTKLVYTSADGHFVLTGNEQDLPEVTDRDRGTVTGQVLTFASRDQAIMVSGTSSHITTTKTRIQHK